MAQRPNSTSTRSRNLQPKGPWVEYFYDRAAAHRAVRFIQTHIIHVEGKHAGQPFILEWWQKKLILKFFGWKRRDTGFRKYRVLFLFVPRKNGKTALAAAISLYLLFADKEAAAQVICAAADKDQAGIVFRMASEMVKANALLTSLTPGRPYKSSIFSPPTNSVFKVLSKKPNTKHGANVHGAIIDEVHAIEDRELVDVITTSTIARSQPVVIYLSTAGFDKAHFFFALYNYAKMVKADPSKDERWLVDIYEADPDKWQDPQEWIRCNPNFNVTMDMESFMVDYRMAKEMTAYENTFKRLRLNVWTEQDSRAIAMEIWNECSKPTDLYPIESLRRQECYLGLDLASTTDLASCAIVFPPAPGRDFYDIIMHYWFPEENIAVRARKIGNADISQWTGSGGYITTTPGAVIDYERIRATIGEIDKLYNVREIAFDPWNATHLATLLANDGFEMVKTRQGYATMSDPTKFFLGLILQRRINHRNNPVLSWNAGNFVTEEDPAGNLKPSKKKAKEKIDGICAVIMGLSRAMVNQPATSIYASRGVRVIGV